MGLLTSSWWVDSLTILLILVVYFVRKMNKRHTYWQDRGIASPPTKFFFGNAKDIFLQKKTFAEFSQECYLFFKELNVPHGGFYFNASARYMPIDLDLIKRIMQTDFQHFTDRGIPFNEKADPLSAHLFSLPGLRWKNLRAKLTATFTSGKMRMMFPTMVDCGDQLKVAMEKNLDSGPWDAKETLARFTTDIIASCAFGIDSDCLTTEDNPIREMFRTFFKTSIRQRARFFLLTLAPWLNKRLNISTMPKACVAFFMDMISKTVKYREDKNLYRKDFMHLLLQLKNRGKLVEDQSILSKPGEEKRSALTMNELQAQAFVFFVAGFETSSTTMTFCLYELARNPEIQDKLREEVEEVLSRHNGQVTYESINEMVYMEQVINETLRMYPPVPLLMRNVTEEYKVPETNLTLEKDIRIFIPIYAIHYDEDLYPNPKQFDPERFNEENSKSRHQFAHLPFGEGPRVCIGLRFGMLQTKVGLATLIKNYRFTVSEKTEQPIKLNPQSFILTTKGNMWLNYTKV